MKKVLIIIINYASEKEVVEYAAQIELLAEKDNIALCVVDNKMSENGIDLAIELKNNSYETHYYKASKNLGYLNGALFGLESFKVEQNYVPEWVVISNTDIEYIDKNFYKNFLTNKYNADYWCIAPSVINTEGHFCNPHYKKRIPIAKVNRVIKIFKNPFLMYIYFKLASIKAKFNKENIKQPSQVVYSVHGCFFMLRKAFFEALGEEEYGVVLYSEESFIAEIILENGKLEFYDATIEVKHNENLTTSKLGLIKKGQYMSNSMAYIKQRFYK